MRTHHRGPVYWCLLGAAGIAFGLVSGCATPPNPADKEAVAEFRQVNDPAEPTNRAIFAFNQGLDTVLIKPAAGMYRDLIPPVVRTSIHNALDNLHSPVIFVNEVLQGESEQARITFMRFLINSTIGVGGLCDPATSLGFPYHDEDFGQTLAVWGVSSGPYVMLPVFGPSNPRDATGLAVDYLIDPFNWLAAETGNDIATYARGGTRAVDTRARNYKALEDLKRSSLDYYAAIRSLYRQRRADEILNGTLAPGMPAPGLSRTPPPPRAHKAQEVSSWK